MSLLRHVLNVGRRRHDESTVLRTSDSGVKASTQPTKVEQILARRGIDPELGEELEMWPEH